jgi:hypothetical protein
MIRFHGLASEGIPSPGESRTRLSRGGSWRSLFSVLPLMILVLTVLAVFLALAP